MTTWRLKTVKALLMCFKICSQTSMLTIFFWGASSTKHAKDLMEYINNELGKYNFKVKGWSFTLKPITKDDPLTDENGYVTAFGCQYNTETDTYNTKPGLVHNGLKF